jgi:Rab3 GTPase-activating protein regulatory subunit N-terminus
VKLISLSWYRLGGACISGNRLIGILCGTSTGNLVLFSQTGEFIFRQKLQNSAVVSLHCRYCYSSITQRATSFFLHYCCKICMFAVCSMLLPLRHASTIISPFPDTCSARGVAVVFRESVVLVSEEEISAALHEGYQGRRDVEGLRWHLYTLPKEVGTLQT